MARLAFFGTPAFAAASLASLLRARAHQIVLVVCQPDRPRGRGQKLEAPPVKVLAAEHGIEVMQPSTWKAGTPDGDASFARFTSLGIDLAVVAAYGRILPKRLLASTPRGFVNVHASLLPRWRGAAPIQRAIEAGDAETGVCLMDMIYELDAGDVYARRAIPIAADDDGESLTDKLAHLGGALLEEHLDALVAGTLPKTPQTATGITYAAMLRKDEGAIDWTRDARAIVDHARAMHPWPGASTSWRGEALKLFAPTIAAGSGAPGTVLSVAGTLVVAAGAGAVAFAAAQVPGKRRMPIAELARGVPLVIGTRLGA